MTITAARVDGPGQPEADDGLPSIDPAPSIDTVRALIARYSNWGRWGPDDELGTLNHIQPADVVEASRLVHSGRVFSLSIPVDENGPQQGGFGRFNPHPPDDPRRQRRSDRHDGA